MELTMKKKRASQRGTSLIELMIASLVLMVGVLGCAVLIPIAIGTNSRNRQQSNSTVIAQMTMEKITSASAGGAAALTITDCAGIANTIMDGSILVANMNDSSAIQFLWVRAMRQVHRRSIGTAVAMRPFNTTVARSIPLASRSHTESWRSAS
jgi:type II secretory pathway pseudopilin PulG